MAVATYPVGTIAKLLMLTPRRISQLVEEGVLPKASRGKYELVPCVQAYVKHLRDRAVNGDVQSGGSDGDRARLVRAQADKAEVEARMISGDFVSRAEVQKADEILFTALHDRLLAIPNACAERVVEAAGRDGPRGAAEVVRSFVEGAMADLSSAEIIGTA